VGPIGRTLAALILALVPTLVDAREERAEPRIVLMERNPWLAVIGSDSPTFALYANGLVIFRGNAGSGEYLAALLGEREYQDLLANLMPQSVLRLRDSYTASERTDQATNELHVWADGKRKSVSVYGAIRRSPDVRKKTPAAFLAAFDTITGFTAPARPWLPEEIEVLLWPFDHSRKAPVPWPGNWPSFSQARARGDSGLHQLMLPAGQCERLRELLGALHGNRAVLLDGRKWTVSYRLPFPREDAWMQ
jgi:hypothetical protein